MNDDKTIKENQYQRLLIDLYHRKFTYNSFIKQCEEINVIKDKKELTIKDSRKNS